MPFKIRAPQDIDQFSVFIKAVAKALQQKITAGEFSANELTQSISRINRYKIKYVQLAKTSITKQIEIAQQLIASPQHLKLEQALADHAVVFLTNQKLTYQKQLIPINVNKVEHIHLFVLNWQEFRALKQAIISHWQISGKPTPQVSATVVSEGDAHTQLASGAKLAKADLVIATIDTKIASVVDIGGVEDLLTKTATLKNEQDKVSYAQLLSEQLQQAQQQKVTSILIAKGSPYLLQAYNNLADVVIVTFDDRIYQKVGEQSNQSQTYSPGYNTSLAIVFGKQKALGKLPVSLPSK